MNQMRTTRKYKKLSYEDRKKIESLFQDGTSISLVAKLLDVHISTIYHELHRCGATPETYTAQNAQELL